MKEFVVIKVVRSPKGDLQLQPSFTVDTTFFVPTNPQPLKEGEYWKVVFEGEKKPTGKKDKKNRNICVQKVTLLERYITEILFEHEAPYWIIKELSGPHIVRSYKKEGDKKIRVDHFRRVVLLMDQLIIDGDVRAEERLNSVSFDDICKGNIPEWLPQDVIESVHRWMENIRKEEQKKLNSIKEKEELLRSGGPLPEDLLREFLIRGISVIWSPPDTVWPDHRMPFFGHEFSLFKVGNFIFGLGVNTLDEDYIEFSDTFPSSAGDISDPGVKHILKKIAYFASHPEHPIQCVLDMQVPSESVLFNRREWLSGYSVVMGNFTDTVSVSEEEKKSIIASINEDLDRIKKNYKELTKEFIFQDLIRIKWKSILEVDSGETTDVEEGIGKKDDTTYHTTYAFGKAVQKWIVEELSISDSVSPLIASAIKKCL